MKKELVPGYQLSGIPDLFHEAFSGCEQHHKALQEEKKLPGPEQLTELSTLPFWQGDSLFLRQSPCLPISR